MRAESLGGYSLAKVWFADARHVVDSQARLLITWVVIDFGEYPRPLVSK